jgi:hypothetical protein
LHNFEIWEPTLKIMARTSAKPTVRKTKNSRRQRVASKQSATSPLASVVTATPAPVAEAAAASEQATVWRLLGRTLAHGRQHWQFWLKFLLLFAVLNLLLVHNVANDVASLKAQLASFLGTNSPATGLGTYALLLATNSSAAGAAGAYQYLLLIIGSLAAIWSLRQFMSDQPPATLRLRDSLYRGMAPLIPFVLVLIVLSLELIPVVLSGGLYGIVASGGIIRTWFEQLLFLAIFFAGLGLTIWLLMRTIFALYIVTLTDMTPMRALRDANQIVKGRQLNVMRKLIFLLAVLLLGSMLILIPVIFIAPAATQWVFFLLGIAALPFAHAYLYSFYRELLG